MPSNLLRNAVLASFLSAAAIGTTQAQTFQPSIADEFTYGSPLIKDPTDISVYSSEYVESPFGLANMYLTGWGNPRYASEFVWQFLAPNSTTVIKQGSFMYANVSSISVSSMTNLATNQVQLLVAYHKRGSGHFLDIYDVTNSTSTPVVYNSTIQLSNSTRYGRIRMDAFYKHTVGITWERPGIGIQTLAGQNGAWSTIKTLNGTLDKIGPDIALGHDQVNYVYHDGLGNITESAIDLSTLMVPGTTTVSPLIQDYNSTGMTLTSDLVIDCPDHMGPVAPPNTQSWAYTYTNNAQVFVRYTDYNGTGIPNTSIINDGSLGNQPTYGAYKAFTPSLHFGIYGGYTDDITVAWYTTDYGSNHSYIGLQLNTNTPNPTIPSLRSTPDYMSLPHGATNATENFPVSALSKSDFELINRYLYGAYATFDDNAGHYVLHHAFHEWGNTIFKEVIKTDFSQIKAYPNPFSTEINTAVTLKEKGNLRLELRDVTGRLMAQKELHADKGTYPMQMSGLDNIIPGTYFLSTFIDGKNVQTRTVIKNK